MTQPFDTHETPFDRHDAPFDRFDQFGGAGEAWTGPYHCMCGILPQYCDRCGTQYCQACSYCRCSSAWADPIWGDHQPGGQDWSEHRQSTWSDEEWSEIDGTDNDWFEELRDAYGSTTEEDE